MENCHKTHCNHQGSVFLLANSGKFSLFYEESLKLCCHSHGWKYFPRLTRASSGIKDYYFTLELKQKLDWMSHFSYFVTRIFHLIQLSKCLDFCCGKLKLINATQNYETKTRSLFRNWSCVKIEKSGKN